MRNNCTSFGLPGLGRLVEPGRPAVLLASAGSAEPSVQLSQAKLELAFILPTPLGASFEVLLQIES